MVSRRYVWITRLQWKTRNVGDDHPRLLSKTVIGTETRAIMGHEFGLNLTEWAVVSALGNRP